MPKGLIMSEVKEKKERVFVPHEEFIPAYKKALEQKMKLEDFAKEIGQAPQSIIQRVAKINKQIRGYAETYAKMGINEPPVLPYLSQATGKARGRKTLTPNELIKLLGLKTDSPV